MLTKPTLNAVLKAENGRAIAMAIDDAIAAEQPTDSLELSILAHRVRLCNNIGNLWSARDLNTQDGELYDGAGKYWACGSKLCPGCLEKQSRRNRSHARESFRSTPLLSGEYRHFLTLTMPTQDLPLLKAREILYHAWTMFRKRDWFKQHIRGGVRSEEFTVNKTGYHYHMHILCISKYIHYRDFRREWTSCVASAFETANRPLIIKTKDGLLDANVRRVRSLENAVREVAKYITKNSSWRKIPKSDLLDICRIRRFPRMFDFFGDVHRTPKPTSVDEAEGVVNKTILDTQCITDAQDDGSWRYRLAMLGPVNYLASLKVEIAKAREWRLLQLQKAYPMAIFCIESATPTLSDAMLIARSCATTSQQGPLSM